MLMNEDLSISKRKLKVCDAAVNLLEHHSCNSSPPPVFLGPGICPRGQKKIWGLCSQHPLGPNYSVKTIDFIDAGGGEAEPLNLSILLHWYKVDNNLNDRLGSREREFSFT